MARRAPDPSRTKSSASAKTFIFTSARRSSDNNRNSSSNGKSTRAMVNSDHDPVIRETDWTVPISLAAAGLAVALFAIASAHVFY